MCTNSKRSGTCLCAGCKAYFCRKHFNSHHMDLVDELNVYIEERNLLQDQVNKIEYYDDNRGVILLRIDEWQRNMIEKVHQVAEQARQQVKQPSPKRAELASKLAKFSERLVHLRETEDLVEDDLRQLSETVDELKQDFKLLTEPLSMELHLEQSDKIAWDRLISVTTKPMVQNRTKPYAKPPAGEIPFSVCFCKRAEEYEDSFGRPVRTNLRYCFLSQ